MGIAKNQLSFHEYFANEIYTLRFISGLAPIKTSFFDLSNKAQIYYYQYKGKKNRSFEFECELDLVIEKEERKVGIEVKVTPDYAFSSYALTMYQKEADEFQLMRKFHFDFVPQTKFEDKKPIYHLQYGGTATPKIKTLGVDDKNIIPWLSVPRLNYSPINLALLLDVIFCEFPNETTISITERSEWRDFIKMNEELILKDYYSRMRDFFQNKHKSDFLFREFCYGKK